MAAEDRDRLFERALARHLHDEAQHDALPCLDGEMWAAYQEGALSEEEMSAAKNHLGSCPRCREIVAQLAATEPLSESKESEGELAVGLAAHATNDAGKVARFPARKRWLLRWAAPVGAIAAGALLYVGVRDFRWQSRRAEPATQIAENRGDNNALARNSYPPPAAPQSTSRQKDEEFADEIVRQPAAKPMPGEARKETENFRTKQPSLESSRDEKKPGARLASPKTVAPDPLAGGLISGSDQGRNLAKTESPVIAKSLHPQQQASAQNGQYDHAQKSGAAGAAAASPAPPPPAPTSSQQITANAAAPGAARESVEVESASTKKDKDASFMSRNVISDLAQLPSGGIAQSGKSIWRFGERGAISHSGDGGRTWTSQVAPVFLALSSGSAPAKNICWIGGADGALLRTTDGGKRWQLIITPIAGNLGGVLATDGKHATIWDAPRMQTFRTSDGGKTWEKQPAK